VRHARRWKATKIVRVLGVFEDEFAVKIFHRFGL
jgi:hypothetical protein